MSKKDICKTCEHWKSEQAELSYSTFYGICVSPKLKYSSSNRGDALVLDRNNLDKAHHNASRFENVSTPTLSAPVERSRYCLVTEEKFGCINYLKK